MLTKSIILLSIITLFVKVNFAQDAWGNKVFLNTKEKPLRDVLIDIREQTELNLIFNDNLTSKKLLTCDISSSAENVLKEVLNNSGFTLKKYNNNSAVIFEKKKMLKKAKAVVRKTNAVEVLSEPELIKPTLISKLELIYPAEAISEGIEGEVFAKLLVSTKGEVINVYIGKSSGHKVLDTATINYIKKLEFLPAEFNGRYKDVWTTMRVKFNFE